MGLAIKIFANIAYTIMNMFRGIITVFCVFASWCLLIGGTVMLFSPELSSTPSIIMIVLGFFFGSIAYNFYDRILYALYMRT